MSHAPSQDRHHVTILEEPPCAAAAAGEGGDRIAVLPVKRLDRLHVVGDLTLLRLEAEQVLGLEGAERDGHGRHLEADTLAVDVRTQAAARVAARAWAEECSADALGGRPESWDDCRYTNSRPTTWTPIAMQLSENQALQLAAKALESKAITLLGPPNRQHAAETGEADAQYLKALLIELMKPTP